MPIRVYNTLSNQKEAFEPVAPGKVGMYLCGPTVYKPSHIGHMVGPVIFDVIKRYLTYRGYQVTWVVNVTDVDDKLIKESAQRGISMKQLADEMTADYMQNLEAMGVDTIDHFPNATDNIAGIIDFTRGLIEQGFAYESGGDVYFEVSKDAEYGKLSNRSLDDLHGEGGEMAGRKRSPHDFALWKSAKPGEPAWDSPWGRGRPGWHIECSVMSHAILGETFDIHGGGLDLVFPHHENEIAQSECRHGKPQAKYWLHNGLMQAADEAGKVGGRARERTEDMAATGSLSASAGSRADKQPMAPDVRAQEAGKISKSKGAGPFRELLKTHSPEAIRLLLISTHYRSPILFSEEEIERQAARLETFYRFFKRYERVTGESFYAPGATGSLPASAGTRADEQPVAPCTESSSSLQPPASGLLQELLAHRQAFIDKMDDDFNTAGAIASLYESVSALNRFVEQEKLESGPPDAAKVAALREGAGILREMALVLGLFREPPKQSATADDQLTGRLMELLIQLRADARKEKNFALGDKIRGGLTAIGVKLEDRAGGTEWTIEK